MSQVASTDEKSLTNIKNIEKLLEKEVIHLDNGDIRPMLIRFRTETFWTYLCFPCGATCLGETFLHSHLHGKKHTMQLLSKTIWPASIIKDHPYYIREAIKSSKNSASSTSRSEEIVVAPGEPVPPGIDEVNTASIIEESLKNYENPLIGLEYLIELIREDGEEPYYFCALCGIRGDPRTIIKHIDGFRHKMKYMAVHYPTCHSNLSQYAGQKKYYPGNLQVLHNICQCIHQAFGRLKPLVINMEDFEKNKTKYLKQIANGKHFSEKDGGTFEELIDKEYILTVSSIRKQVTNEFNPGNTPAPSNKSISPITLEEEPKEEGNDKTNSKDTGKKIKPKSLRQKRLSVDSISSLSNVSDDEDNLSILNLPLKISKNTENHNTKNVPIKYNKSQNFKDRSPRGRSPPRRESPSRRRSRGRSLVRRKSSVHGRSPLSRRSPIRNRSPHIRQLRSRSREKGLTIKNDFSKTIQKNDGIKLRDHMEDKQKWALYHKQVNKFCEEARKIYEHNEQFPENHPLYQEEWKKFWNKKYKECQDVGRDVWQCDMKPEWIRFWGNKMRELYDAEFMKKREDILKELGLPLDSKTELLEHNDFKPVIDTINLVDSPKSGSPASIKGDIVNKEPSKERKRSREISREREKRLRLRNKESYYSEKIRDKSLERIRALDRERERRSRDRSYDRFDGRSRYMDKNMRDLKMRRRSRSPFDLRKHSSRILSEQLSKVEREKKDIKWSIYYSKIRLFKDKMLRKMEEYEENPKYHPMYHSEWLKFRSKLADDQIVDINTEWLKYWRRRVADLFDRDLAAKQNELIKELDLYGESSAEFDYYARKYNRESPNNSRRESYIEEVTVLDAENLNVVVVLRHLTALENYLGSLGPKVIDLLALVLKKEKEKPNSSEDILINDTYLVLLETVKEKLKGQLLANLIDSHVIQATKTAIKYTATLLHAASLKAAAEKKTHELNAKSVPVVGVGSVEKAAIANQIADALIAQGKTDVSTEELEKLITAVVGMANAAEISKLESTPSLLAQLTEMHNKQQFLINNIASSSTNSSIKRSPMNGLQVLKAAYDKTSTNLAVQDAAFSDKLSDSDLKTLLHNFKDLPFDEQHRLLSYLNKLETINPRRVENLKKTVNFDVCVGKYIKNTDPTRPASPFSNRVCGTNPSIDDAKTKNNTQKKVTTETAFMKSKESDDDDDYSYEEVIKCAAEKVKEKQLQEELEIIKQSLKDSREEDPSTSKPTFVKEPEITSSDQISNIIRKEEIDTVALGNILQLVKNATNAAKSTNPLIVTNNSLFPATTTQSPIRPNININNSSMPPLPQTDISLNSQQNQLISNMPLSIIRETTSIINNTFPPSNQFQPVNECTNRPLMPHSSGLGKKFSGWDAYNSNQINKMDGMPNRNISFNCPPNQYQMNKKIDNFQTQDIGIQNRFDCPPNKNNSFINPTINNIDMQQNFGNRFNIQQGDGNQMPRIGNQQLNQIEVNFSTGNNNMFQQDFNIKKGRISQRGGFPNRGRGGNRPFGDSYRRGGSKNF